MKKIIISALLIAALTGCQETIENIVVRLDKTELELLVGFQTTITAIVAPYQTIIWSSDTPSVATVDQEGNVAAIAAGTANITAEAGGVTSTCVVKVFAFGVADTDYIDEYGVNHGKGVVIGRSVWAPVDCGYHQTDFPYGKHYQWGRKYGQGLGKPYDSFEVTYVKAPVDLEMGQNKYLDTEFYYGEGEWANVSDGQRDKLWNSGSESSPVKSAYDPCPDGWRVPIIRELYDLAANHSGLITLDSGIKGMYFSGICEYSETAKHIFLSASGIRNYNCSLFYMDSGFYWSSFLNSYGVALCFHDHIAGVSENSPACGCSVRCVQE